MQMTSWLTKGELTNLLTLLLNDFSLLPLRNRLFVKVLGESTSVKNKKLNSVDEADTSVPRCSS